MDVQIKSKQVLDKCEAMSLLCMNASNYWNTIKTFDKQQLISYYEGQEYYKNRKLKV